MEEFVPTEIPTPALLIVAHQTLITDTVKGCFCRRNAHHGVRASLPRAPEQLPDVHSFRVPYPPSYAICALGHGMPVKCQLVIILKRIVDKIDLKFFKVLTTFHRVINIILQCSHRIFLSFFFFINLPKIKDRESQITYLNEYVETTIVGVPAMMNLCFPRSGWHVEKDIEPWRPREVLRQLSWYHWFVSYDAATADADSTDSSCCSLACHAFNPSCNRQKSIQLPTILLTRQ